MRTTRTELESLARHIGTLLGAPAEAWRKEGGRNRANVGAYVVDGSLNIHSLRQITNEDGAVSIVLSDRTRRGLADQMRTYIAGIEAARKSA